ncbi:PRC-barrel domain-containing protein [Jeotgalibacillus salarius]|uniref:Photosystem reaction center subunit H n=1 Tax=Jeotgalibacillus salarius TaxID=546023 RepID=A0A4Y8LHB7_9BACL|nr:PRC-barrel domain-containing protein [Jeotgalibacillus salarius]TFE01014.1 photosystem reaction center subunit H [Jeotgalibacillus salarius]
MKNSTELIGLPVISITDGTEIGTVKSIVVNPEKRSVDFIAIEHEDWQTSVRAIPFKKIIGLGGYAITVENSGAVIDLNEIPIANQLLNRKISVSDTKAITKKGALAGEIIEYYFNEDTGSIEKLNIESSEKNGFIDADHVITYGKDIIVLEEEALSAISESLETATAEVSKVDQMKEKQMTMLVGKTLKNDITDYSGEKILSAGDVLTQEQIELTKQKGPSTFAKLATSVE